MSQSGETRYHQGMSHNVEGSLSQAELFEMRRMMVEMVEELKIKRKSVAASEKNIDALVKQLHSLQREKDTEQQKAQQKEEHLERSLNALREKYDDAVKKLNVEKRQQQVKEESKLQVKEKMKDEMIKLVETLHRKEKQVQELEIRLKAEGTAAQQVVSGWKQAQDKLGQLTQLHKTCQQSVTRLEMAGKW